MESYKKDKHSPMCPYIGFHNGEKCKMYLQMNKTDEYKDRKSL